jgi:hypothetical protein
MKKQRPSHALLITALALTVATLLPATIRTAAAGSDDAARKRLRQRLVWVQITRYPETEARFIDIEPVRLENGQTKLYPAITYYSGTPYVQVAVSDDDGQELALTILDEKGGEVARSNQPSPTCTVKNPPGRTGKFTTELTSVRGSGMAAYQVLQSPF